MIMMNNKLENEIRHLTQSVQLWLQQNDIEVTEDQSQLILAEVMNRTFFDSNNQIQHGIAIDILLESMRHINEN